MIDIIIELFLANNTKRTAYEKKLVDSGMKDEMIVKMMLYKFLSAYGGADEYTEDLVDLLTAAEQNRVDEKLFLQIPKLCTKKRREALLGYYSRLVNIYDSKVLAFAMAIEKTQKEIKKTGNSR